MPRQIIVSKTVRKISVKFDIFKKRDVLLIATVTTGEIQKSTLLMSASVAFFFHFSISVKVEYFFSVTRMKSSPKYKKQIYLAFFVEEIKFCNHMFI